MIWRQGLRWRWHFAGTGFRAHFRRNRDRRILRHRRLCIEQIVMAGWNDLQFRAASGAGTARRRPVQLGFRKHRLAFVPALSAVDQTIGPVRPRVRRPLRAALLCLRRRCRKHESDCQKASDVSAQKNQPESAHQTLTQSMEQKSHRFKTLGHQLSRNFDGFPQVVHSRYARLRMTKRQAKRSFATESASSNRAKVSNGIGVWGYEHVPVELAARFAGCAGKSGPIDGRDLKSGILKRGHDALRNDLGFLWIKFVSRMIAEALEQSRRDDCVGLMLVTHA